MQAWGEAPNVSKMNNLLRLTQRAIAIDQQSQSDVSPQHDSTMVAGSHVAIHVVSQICVFGGLQVGSQVASSSDPQTFVQPSSFVQL